MLKAVKRRKTDTVFVLIIFSIFAISVLMVLMLGASIYKNMTDISRDGQEDRMVLSYIWTKVKNNDDAGSVYVGDFDGIPALCFDQIYGETLYQTSIYHYDGWVYELFREKGLDLYPEDGENILKIGALTFEELEYGMIRASTGEGSLLITPRGSN